MIIINFVNIQHFFHKVNKFIALKILILPNYKKSRILFWNKRKQERQDNEESYFLSLEW